MFHTLPYEIVLIIYENINNVRDIFHFFNTCTYMQKIFLEYKRNILKRTSHLILSPCIMNKIINFKKWKEKRKKCNALKYVPAHHEIFIVNNDKKFYPQIIQIYHRECRRYKNKNLYKFKYELFHGNSIIRFVKSNVPLIKYNITINSSINSSINQSGHDISSQKTIKLFEEYGGIICHLFSFIGITFSCIIEEKYLHTIKFYTYVTYLDDVTQINIYEATRNSGVDYYSKNFW